MNGERSELGGGNILRIMLEQWYVIFRIMNCIVLSLIFLVFFFENVLYNLIYGFICYENGIFKELYYLKRDINLRFSF